MRPLDFNHPDVEAVKKHVKYVTFSKGEIILQSYEETEYIHAVMEGLVKSYSINARGEETIGALFGPNDIFPFAWMINERRPSVFIQALSDCRIALLPIDIFKQQLKESPDVAFAITKKVVEQFVLYTSAVNNLSLKFGRERLAYRLILLAGKFGSKQGRSFILPHISQTDLGAMVNVSREGVSREMSRFDRLGILKYTGRAIEILDIDQLQKEVGEDVLISFQKRSN